MGKEGEGRPTTWPFLLGLDVEDYAWGGGERREGGVSIPHRVEEPFGALIFSATFIEDKHIF